MKTIRIFFVAALFMNALSAFAQTTNKEAAHSGIYLTLANFHAGKLTYEIDCSKEKHKIKLHDFAGKAYIDVIHDGVKHTLQKKDIYAFVDCDNNVFRFFNNSEYQLHESLAISIYSKQESQSEYKSFKLVDVYYFSVGDTGAIKPLTIENLKYAFPDNHKFHDMLDAQFKDVTDIAEFDTFHKVYRVNHLYQMSLQ